MDATGLIYMVLGLAAVAAAVTGFFQLFGKAPRDVLMMVAGCVLATGVAIPFVFADPNGVLERKLDLLSFLLLWIGVFGFGMGLVDLVISWRANNGREALFGRLWEQPVVWGAMMAGGFYAAIHKEYITFWLLKQYMAGHAVEYVIGTMFFIGLAALAIRFLDVSGQLSAVKRVTLSAGTVAASPAFACQVLLNELDALPREQQTNCLTHRLREALEMVRRKGSAESIEQHLRYLEDQGALRMHTNYSLIRIIIWAIPILGLLGTVIGITIAITNLNPETLEQSLTLVTKGLGVAFDHTAQALSLTMVLMFTKHAIERSDQRLLTVVDQRAAEQLIGRFETTNTESDPNVVAIRRMSEQVIDAVEASAARQAQVWQSAIDETHQQWADVSTSAGQIINESLSTALRDNLALLARQLNDGALRHAEKLNHSSDETVAKLRQGLEKLAELLVESLQRHGEVLVANERDISEENRRHLSEVEAALGEAMVIAADRQETLIHRSEDLLKEMQIALVSAAESTIRHQEELVRQGDVMLRVVDATGQVRVLEDALNQNLAALAKSHRFDDMALNLTSAIQTLCARVGADPLKPTHAPSYEPIVVTPSSHAA